MQQEPLLTNNSVSVIGRIASDFRFSHEVFGESFYLFDVTVSRLSDVSDCLPVTVSERLMERGDFAIGNLIAIKGQVRSYNNYSEEEGKNRLILTIFARDYEILGSVDGLNPNEVFLNGFICKSPVYRVTPFGREITDILLAVNRSYNKSDYIPCICWGRNAKFAGKLSVSDNIRVFGRIQSRSYQKKLENGEVLDKVAYEISVSRLEQEIRNEGASRE